MTVKHITPTDPTRSVTTSVKVGDTLRVGGPGASQNMAGMPRRLQDGDLVTVTEVGHAGKTVYIEGFEEWPLSIRRFSLPEPKARALITLDPSRVVKSVKAGDRLVIGGPGASIGMAGMPSHLREGDLVTVLRPSPTGETVVLEGSNSRLGWSLARFSLPEPKARALITFDPARSVELALLEVGDTIIAGGPGASIVPLPPLVEGAEYVVAEIFPNGTVIVEGHQTWWDIKRFSLPEPTLKAKASIPATHDATRRFNSPMVRPGDTVIVGGPGASLPVHVFLDRAPELKEGDEVTVESVDVRFDVIRVGGVDGYWDVQRFSLPEPTVKWDGDRARFEDDVKAVRAQLEQPTDDTAILTLTHDPAQVPTRGYDFNKGDRRFVDIEHAVEHAHAVFEKTGVMQVMRIDTNVPHFQATTYLVQAYGS